MTTKGEKVRNSCTVTRCHPAPFQSMRQTGRNPKPTEKKRINDSVEQELENLRIG